VFSSPCASRCCGNAGPHCLRARSLVWAALPHVGIASWRLVPAVTSGARSDGGLGERLLPPAPDPLAALASGGPGRGSTSLALGTSPSVSWGDGARPKREQKGQKQLRIRSWKCVSQSVVSSDKRRNLERYHRSELHEGACGEMIISLPFLLFLSFII